MKLQFHPSATFRGLRHVPLLAVSRNSLYPALEMDEDAIVIQVIRRHALLLSEIATVDVRWRLAHQVTLVPLSGPWTFNANFFDKAGAVAVLKVLGERRVPLTAEARSFIEGEAP